MNHKTLIVLFLLMFSVALFSSCPENYLTNYAWKIYYCDPGTSLWKPLKTDPTQNELCCFGYRLNGKKVIKSASGNEVGYWDCGTDVTFDFYDAIQGNFSLSQYSWIGEGTVMFINFCAGNGMIGGMYTSTRVIVVRQYRL